MDYSSERGEGSWLQRNWKTLTILLFVMALAGFFRIGFNFEPAINDGNPRFAGNDDYYHLRVVQYVGENGNHLEQDPLLNYPLTGINPRPPLFDWHAAIGARFVQMFTGMEHEEASAYVLQWGSAFWGVLTVVPVWLIGRSLYGNAAGLWGGFLLAASPAHIQRSGFGLGDHDAFIIFFLVLGFYFLLRALRRTRDDTRVASWSSLRSISSGFGSYMDHHREGLAYAVLAGLCFATIALTWEGFPYVFAIYAVYYGFQLLTNQIRRRDSTGDVLVMMILLGTTLLLAFPYYWSIGNIGATLTAMAYIFAGLVVATLVLVPTRDLPSVLVLPTLAGAALVAWVVLTFVVPDIGAQIFSANGYFLQSKLYSTIAEAQRTDLGVFVFSLGFMTFFLAMIGFVWATLRFFRQRERDQLFLVAWGLISIVMAFAAARFVFNAAPVFAVLGGWMLQKLVGWMNWRERVRDFRAYRHESWGKAVKSVAGAKQIAGTLFIGLTLIVPNVWFSMDAGLPSEVRANYRQNHPGNDFVETQTGAFGQGFLHPDWIEVYEWLETQDDCDENGRGPEWWSCPAHMAWWDYGFWEVTLGRHPTVADNFQNGVDISGRFIVGQNETEAVEWYIVRLLEADWRSTNGNYGPKVRTLLDAVDPELRSNLPSPFTATRYNVAQQALSRTWNWTADSNTSGEERARFQAVEFYLKLAEATGNYIGYFLSDGRMLPLDDPRTSDIESGSIFYAPAFLANQNPDDFVQTVYVEACESARVQNQAPYLVCPKYYVVSYELTESGASRQVSPPKIIDQACYSGVYTANHTVGPECKLYVSGGNSIIGTLDGRRIDYSASNDFGRGRSLSSVMLEFKEPFYKTMFYRSYVGGDGAKPQGNYHTAPLDVPGYDLHHFRLVKLADSVRLLKFYWGAEVTGNVTYQGGAMEGVSVEVYDEFGARHDSATADAEGRYKVYVPFSTLNETSGQLNNVTVVVHRGGVAVADHGLQITEAQAMRRPGEQWQLQHHFDVQPGRLNVQAFVDRDGDGQYNTTVDKPAPAGASLEASILGGNRYAATTGTDGRADFGEVEPGGFNMEGNLTNYEFKDVSVGVPSGETVTRNVSFAYAKVPFNLTLKLENGSASPGVRVNFTAVDWAKDFTDNATSPATDANGTASVEVIPGGSYRINFQERKVENGTNVTYSMTDITIVVPAPDQDGYKSSYEQAITVTRTEQS